MDKFRELLKGKKTYLVALAGIVTALVGWADDAISTVELIQIIFGAITGMTLRAGITNAVNTVKLFVALLVFAAVFALTAGYAETPPMPAGFESPPAVEASPQLALNSTGSLGDLLWRGVRQGFEYAKTHGEVGAGYFIITEIKDQRWRVAAHGPGTAQIISPAWARITAWETLDLRGGIAAATVPTPEKTYLLALATVSCRIIPEHVGDASLKTPPARLRVKLGGLRAGLFVGTPIDQAQLAGGVQLQWDFQ